MNLTKLSKLTPYHWYEEFRNHLPEDQEVLEPPTQLDETYFGGKNGRALFLGKQVETRKLAYQAMSANQVVREHTPLNTDGGARSHSSLCQLVNSTPA